MIPHGIRGTNEYDPLIVDPDVEPQQARPNAWADHAFPRLRREQCPMRPAPNHTAIRHQENIRQHVEWMARVRTHICIREDGITTVQYETTKWPIAIPDQESAGAGCDDAVQMTNRPFRPVSRMFHQDSHSRRRSERTPRTTGECASPGLLTKLVIHD